MKKLLMMITISFFVIVMLGCSNGTNNSSTATSSPLLGQFIDSGVSGLHYETSSGITGVTDAQGRYNYEPGDSVTFTLGGITIGSCKASDYVTPVDIFPGNLDAAINLAQFLQSVDSDGDPSNGITPSAEAVAVLAKVRQLDFESTSFDTLLRDNLPSQFRFVDSSEASQHMEEAFAKLGIDPGLKYERVFVGADTEHGFELWKTDGKLQNTKMIKDLNPTATLDSEPNNFITFGTKILFTASDGVHGRELWISDGTIAGTYMLKDIYSGYEDSRFRYFTVVGDICFFQARDKENGSELWKTDGTAEGTVLVKDIREGSSSAKAPSRGPSLSTTQALSSNPQYLTNVDGTLLFSAYTDDTGWELWRSDGTSQGTTLVKDITTGSDSFSPRDFQVLSNKLLFVDSYSNSLWVSDATEEGTENILSLTDANIYTSVVMNGKLYFAVDDTENNSGAVLWESNGTVDGTSVVKDLLPGNSGISIYNPTVAGDKFYFQARENSDNTNQVLWVSDGTEDGTHVVTNSTNDNLINPSYFTALGETIYFQARSNSNTHGTELWKSDGTKEGTLLVKDINVNGTSSSYPEDIYSLEGNLYFRAYDGTQRGLWISDGTTQGTRLLHTINHSYPDEYTVLNTKVFFAFNENNKGEELWVSDATTSGTVFFKDINKVSTSSLNPSTLIRKIGNKNYFVTNIEDEEESLQLWVSDGTKGGTYPLASYYDMDFAGGVELNGNLVLYVEMEDGISLVKTDGTVDGTVTIATYEDVNQGLVSLNGKLFFVAEDSSTGTTLHISDGTADGTEVFRGPNDEVYEGAEYLTAVGNKLFFSYYVESTGNDSMYVTDATAAGTKILIDENSDISFRDFIAVGDKLYFRAHENDDGSSNNSPSRAPDNNGLNHGDELWVSDGTVDGTKLLKNIADDEDKVTSSYPNDFVNVNGTLYFTADDDIHGEELWKSDGTTEGTVMVSDLIVGEESSYPRIRAVVGDTLYFTTESEECCENDLLWSINKESNTAVAIDLNVQGQYYLYSIEGLRKDVVETSERYWLVWLELESEDGHYVLKKITGTEVETFQDLRISNSGGPK